MSSTRLLNFSRPLKFSVLMGASSAALCVFMSSTLSFAQSVSEPAQHSTDLWNVLRGSQNLQNAQNLQGSQNESEQNRVFQNPVSDDLAEEQTANQPTNVLDVRQTRQDPAQQGRVRSVQAEPQVLDDINTGTPSSRANVRQAQVEEGVRRQERSDPYAAEGFSFGSWNGNLSIEQNFGFSSNIDRAANGSSGGFSQSDVNLSLQSDWARHQATLNATGSYRRNLSGSDNHSPLVGINGALRLDLKDQTTLTLTTGYNYSTEAVTSTLIGANVAERPGAHSYNAAAEFNSAAQRLSFSLRGSVEKQEFEDGTLVGGGILDQEDRNNLYLEGRARIGYEVSPAITPFFELRYGQRNFDLAVDRNGDVRDRAIYALSAGTAIDLGDKLSGEVSIGYQREVFDGAGIADLDGVTLNGALNWSPWREMVVGLTAATSFNGTTQSGQSGTIVHSLGASIERQATERLSLDMRLGADVTQQNDGDIDTILVSAGAGVEYSLNKHLALTGDLTFEQQFADDSTRDYNAVGVQAGVRWQK